VNTIGRTRPAAALTLAAALSVSAAAAQQAQDPPTQQNAPAQRTQPAQRRDEMGHGMMRDGMDRGMMGQQMGRKDMEKGVDGEHGRMGPGMKQGGLPPTNDSTATTGTNSLPDSGTKSPTESN
jgi:hypothetical protein